MGGIWNFDVRGIDMLGCQQVMQEFGLFGRHSSIVFAVNEQETGRLVCHITGGAGYRSVLGVVWSQESACIEVGFDGLEDSREVRHTVKVDDAYRCGVIVALVRGMKCGKRSKSKFAIYPTPAEPATAETLRDRADTPDR